MIGTLQRLRPLLIGLVVLLFSAGIALAGKPSAPPDWSASQTEVSGPAVPAQVAGDEDEADEDDDEDEAAEAEPADAQVEDAVKAIEGGETDEDGGENCAMDPTGLTDEALAELKHGSIVCWAAHQETPDGYRNHGEWVSEWARKDHDHAAEAVDENAAETVNGHAAKGKANGRT